MSNRTITRRRRSAEPEETQETQEEPRSARRGRRRSEESAEEETKPAGRGRFRGKSREDSFAEGAEEATGDSTSGRKARKASENVGKGWGSFEEKKTEGGGDFPVNFKFGEGDIDPEDEIIIKFLDSEPVAVWQEYWVTKPGRKSYPVISESDPLAQLGIKPAARAAFNIAVFRDPEADPTLEVYTASTAVGKIIQKYAQDEKTSPLTREDVYFAINRSGKKKGEYRTNLRPVKARDLEEDWDIVPLTEEELDALDEQCWDEDKIVNEVSWDKMQEVADDLEEYANRRG